MSSVAAAPSPVQLVSLLSQLAANSSLAQVVFIRHAARNELTGGKEQRDAEPITEEGFRAAMQLSDTLESTTLVIGCLWYGSKRTEQTAQALACSLSNLRAQVHGLCGVAKTRQPGYEEFKQQHGWNETMRLWVTGALPASLLLPPSKVVASIASVLVDAATSAGIVPCTGEVLLVATHNIFIFAFYTALRGQPVTAVPFLEGIAVPWAQIQEVAANAAGAHDPTRHHASPACNALCAQPSPQTAHFQITTLSASLRCTSYDFLIPRARWTLLVRSLRTDHTSTASQLINIRTDRAFHLAYSQPQCVALVAMKNVIVELRLLQSFGRPCLY